MVRAKYLKLSMNLPPLETACTASPKFQISKENLDRTGCSPKSGLHIRKSGLVPFSTARILDWTGLPQYWTGPDYCNSGPDQKENWKSAKLDPTPPSKNLPNSAGKTRG